MTFADFRNADTQLRTRLAQTKPKLFLALEVPRFAAYVALVLVVFDTFPWDMGYGEGQPMKRLLFILPWAIGMAFWFRWDLLRRAPQTRRHSSRESRSDTSRT